VHQRLHHAHPKVLTLLIIEMTHDLKHRPFTVFEHHTRRCIINIRRQMSYDLRLIAQELTQSCHIHINSLIVHHHDHS